MSKQKYDLLGLLVETSLHPGCGSALEAVDLPVDRESHTGWPVLRGSAVKGVLRDAVRDSLTPLNGNRKTIDETDPILTAIFGPGKVDESSGYAGAFGPADARLMALPVRSLRGTYATVTCPMALDDLRAMAGLAGIPLTWTTPSLPKGKDTACVTTREPECACQLPGGRQLVLEEFELTAEADSHCDALAKWLADHLLPANQHHRLDRSLVVIQNDLYTYLTQTALEVTTRVALEYETKTVRTGALFSQEFIPPESLLVSLVTADAPRRTTRGLSDGDEVLKRVVEELNGRKVLQFGGDATTGKGLCWVRMARSQRESAGAAGAGGAQ